MSGNVCIRGTPLALHPADAEAMGKPLLLEEFGKTQDSRDAYYSATIESVEASLKSGGALKGALFW